MSAFSTIIITCGTDVITCLISSETVIKKKYIKPLSDLAGTQVFSWGVAAVDFFSAKFRARFAYQCPDNVKCISRQNLIKIYNVFQEL